MKLFNLGLLNFCFFVSLNVIKIQVNANEIDNLRTDKQVIAFIKKLSPKDERIRGTVFSPYYIYDTKTKKTADSLGVRNWVKIDFDKNGETDLIAFNLHNLQQIVAVFSINGKYKKINSTWGVRFKYSHTYPVLKNIKNKNLIIIFHNEVANNIRKLEEEIKYTQLECDTIMFENSMFLNYYSTLTKSKVESIKIKRTNNDVGGLVKVDVDFTNLESYCFETMEPRMSKDRYRYKLTQAEILKIKCLLEQSNFINLNDNNKYNIEHFDYYSVEIEYDNKKVKKIEDIGGVVNYNFAEIYEMINNFKWIKMN